MENDTGSYSYSRRSITKVKVSEKDYNLEANRIKLFTFDNWLIFIIILKFQLDIFGSGAKP